MSRSYHYYIKILNNAEKYFIAMGSGDQCHQQDEGFAT
jgi:hypothetical protein